MTTRRDPTAKISEIREEIKFLQRERSEVKTQEERDKISQEVWDLQLEIDSIEEYCS